MKRVMNQLALTSLLGAAFLGACGKEKLTCGPGTEKSGDECVAKDVGSNLGGMGGDMSSSGGSASGGEPNRPDPDVDPIADPRFEDISPTRRGDAALTVDEFEGAIAAAAASTTSAVVVWKPVTVFDVTYNIYVSTKDDNFSFGTPQFTAPPGADSFLLTGLEAEEEHFIVIRPVLEGVELPVDDVIVSVTLEKDEEPPSFVGVGDVESADGASVTLSWDAGSDDVTPDEVLTYFVYFAEAGEEVDFRTADFVSPPGATEVTVQLPRPDTDYDFVVRVRDAAGLFDDNTEVVTGTSGPDVEEPIFGGCVSAEVRNASTVDLSWAPAKDDIATADEMVYNIYVSTEDDGHNFSQPAATITGGTTGSVTGLLPKQLYYFVCRAADPSGNEESNTRLQFGTTEEDDQPPVFGGIATVENIGSSSFDLTWDAATDNQSLPEEIDYLVFASDTPDGHDFENDTPVAEVLDGATAVSVQDVSSRTQYYVVVLAVDDSGNVSEPGTATMIQTLVSLRRDIEIPIYQNKCATTGCHSGDTPTSGMNLSPGFSFLNTVGVPTTTALGAGKDRITAFSPTDSHLMERIKSVDDAVRMPLSGDRLSDQEIATIEQWVNEGALNN